MARGGCGDGVASVIDERVWCGWQRVVLGVSEWCGSPGVHHVWILGKKMVETREKSASCKDSLALLAYLFHCLEQESFKRVNIICCGVRVYIQE